MPIFKLDVLLSFHLWPPNILRRPQKGDPGKFNASRESRYEIPEKGKPSEKAGRKTMGPKVM